MCCVGKAYGTYTLSADESQLYPECVVTRAMAKKAKRETQYDATGVMGDIDGTVG